MIGRGKSKKAGSKGLSQRRKEDRISQLPDPLVCNILSCLPTKDAVKTSVLSTRWRSLWLWVPSLDLDSRDFPERTTFVSFGDRFFDAGRASWIQKLILDIYKVDDDEDDASYLTSWIGASVKRKIQHLHVQCYPEYLYEMPISLFTCETLVFLKLQWVALPDTEFVSLPCLKTMHLVRILYPNEATFERLVSSCPVLEKLDVYVARNDAKFYRVHSRSLKRLLFLRDSSVQLDSVSGVVIDAPLLRCLGICDNVSNIFLVNNLESNATLGITLDFGSVELDEASVLARRSRIRSFLPGISRVKDLVVDSYTFKVIHDYSKLEPLPQFRSLYHLHATLCVSDLNWLPIFLESCPNLKVLTMALADYDESKELNQITFPSVPECLLSSLEFVIVHFKAPISGYASEMELVKYFLENSAILKKLALRVNHGSTSIDSDIFKELLKIPKQSATCQVVFI